MSTPQPTTQAGIDFADGEDDGLTALIVSIEDQARADERRRLIFHGRRMVDVMPWITPRALLGALKTTVLDRAE